MMHNLVTVTIPIEHNGEVTHRPTVGELLAPGLAMAPAITNGGLAGTFTLVHVRSGQALHSEGKACAACVRAFVPSMPLFDWEQSTYEIEESFEAQRIADLLAEACARCKQVCAPMETPLFDDGSVRQVPTAWSR